MDDLFVKTCTRCREVKTGAEFHKDAGTKDGLSPRCKRCRSTKRADVLDIRGNVWIDEADTSTVIGCAVCGFRDLLAGHSSDESWVMIRKHKCRDH